MVAIIKFIISAALLSQSSAAVLRSRKQDVSVESIDKSGRHLVVGAPILAAPEVETKDIDIDDLEKRAAAVVNSVTQSDASGIEVAGDPVLASRPNKKVTTTTTITKAASTTKATTTTAKTSVQPRATTTSSASTKSTPLAGVSADTLTGKLIVGEPVLAVRPKPIVSKVSTTLATVVKATQTAVTLH